MAGLYSYILWPNTSPFLGSSKDQYVIYKVDNSHVTYVIFAVSDCELLHFPGSCSDQDDLKLGEEANDLPKKQRTHKHAPSLR